MPLICLFVPDPFPALPPQKHFPGSLAQNNGKKLGGEARGGKQGPSYLPHPCFGLQFLLNGPSLSAPGSC